MTLLVSFARKADYKNDEQKRLGARNPFRPFAFRFFTPSLLFVPIKIVLF